MIRRATDKDFETILEIINDAAMVVLIRHAYVRTQARQKGIGTQLLQKLISGSEKPILIGTWKDADWAIRFYEKQGFHLIDEEEKNRLLRKYWAIPERQVETSVVLADINTLQLDAQAQRGGH